MARAITRYTKINNVFLVSQGRAALTLILRELAADDKRRKVVIPSYTCYTVPAAVVRAGLQIYPIDINTRTLDFDHKCLEEIDSSKVLAIVPSSLFGIPSNLLYLEKFARDRGIWLIDDAAQAFGAKVDDQLVGTFGTAGIYSLSKGKSFTTLQGGILITKDERIANRMRKTIKAIPKKSSSKSFFEIAGLIAYALFLNPSLYWIAEMMPFLGLGRSVFDPTFEITGYNSFFSHIGAFLVEEIDRINKIRRKNAAFLIEQLSHHDGIDFVSGHEGACPVYTRLPILIKNPIHRELIFDNLCNQKLGASLSYPTHINDIPGIGKYLSTSKQNPNGLSVAQSIVTLPTHSLLTQDDLIRISNIVGRHI